MTLYEIDERLQYLIEQCVDIETGEVVCTDEDFSRLYEEIVMDINSKLINSATAIKNLESDCRQLKEEEENLVRRRKAKENIINKIKYNIDNYIKNRINNPEDGDYMSKVNSWKLESPQCKLSYRKSQKVNILDETKIPSEYVTEEIVKKINKSDISDAIKKGQEISGAELVTNLNLQIK